MANWTRETSWRQGSVLTADALASFKLVAPIQLESSLGIIVSHDCDLAQSEEIEPVAEVIVAKIVPDNLNGNLTYGKNPRTLHLSLSEGDRKINVELSALNKTPLVKGRLAEFKPDRAVAPTRDERAILQQWLSSRYRRSGFPDHFEARFKESGIDEKLKKLMKASGAHIRAIFFDVDNGREIKRIDPDDTYSLTIFLLYSTDHDPERSQEVATAISSAIVKLFEAKFQDGNKHWKNIELRDCLAISDEVMTHKEALSFMKWNVDDISLKANPPQAMLD